jgi:Dyp-type peroxidase family
MVDRDTEEQLELDQIQGDVLVGLQKEVELFVGFAILDVARFKRFLCGMPLTTCRDALQAGMRIAAYKENGGKSRLDIRGLNIGFTIDGLRRLGVQGVDGIKDGAFRDGLAKRSADLNDPPEGAGAVANWLVGNGTGPLDGMVLITGRDEAAANAALADLDAAAGDNTWRPFFVGLGNTRRGAGKRGHEHFGFLDGVSQPAVRGRVDAAFPSRKFLDPGQNPADPNQGLPGADLHWPGEFVFGYRAQDKTDVETPAGPADGGLPWMRNGSLMVFRRLEQLVPEFEATVAAKAKDLNESAEILGARMVGRFKSGSPISLDPAVDHPDVAADELKNNDFEFGPDDPVGAKCPFSAHIRKAYPRNDVTPGGAGAADPNKASEADTQTHRIMRRGIPFGMEVHDHEAAAKKTSHSRGLMFVCYQTSIEDQFEFMTKFWINNPDFAKPGTGEDPILGQAKGADRTRHFTGGKLNGGGGPEVTLEADFIRPTGGGYFFMPSIHAIHAVLAA